MKKFLKIHNLKISQQNLFFVKFLEEKKHFTHEQAETLVEAAVEYTNAFGKDIATKHDLAMQKKISSSGLEVQFFLQRE